MIDGKKRTAETYSRIKRLGFETVNWLSFDINNFDGIRDFINFNKPCLFIWDPINCSPDFSKDFIFNLKSVDEVSDWRNKNSQFLDKYLYLITSQISGINDSRKGFVGTVHSDGRGNILCETYHRPGVYNQRELVRPRADFSCRYLNSFVSQDFEIIRPRGNPEVFLSLNMMKDILDLYGGIEGYFEFVRGIQNGRVSFYTTGFENGSIFDFPKDLHNSCLTLKRFK